MSKTYENLEKRVFKLGAEDADVDALTDTVEVNIDKYFDIVHEFVTTRWIAKHGLDVDLETDIFDREVEKLCEELREDYLAGWNYTISEEKKFIKKQGKYEK